MKYKVSEIYGVLLDQAVALCEEVDVHLDCEEEWCYRYVPKMLTLREGPTEVMVTEQYAPSRLWADGGPILEREQISLTSAGMRERIDNQWRAELLGTLLERSAGGSDHAVATGPSALIAAMRAYVASKLGEEVDLP